ncbi:transglycosylase domain-containing protein [Melghirimyces algeriensis]|uniref:transglycosylase domain-containing protein n=1 Tax=Melghirimyces algeriensis TaxID=910412 RepID=UPI00115C111B|nr:transglycosylase domain-containing protein [Melghirimyces algeriensis]
MAKHGESSKKQSSGRMRRFLKGALFTFLTIFTIIVVGSMATVGAATGYVASLVNEEPVRKKAEMKEKISTWTQTSVAYFRDGSTIGKLRGDSDRKAVTVDQVSPHLIDALLSTEDRTFYTHKGISPKGFSRAVYLNVTGSGSSGGSTLTQQLVKNLFLDYREKSLERKSKELFLALRMERLFSKDDILNAYLNTVYFGKNASGRNMLGVQAAAKGLFNVDAKDLNLPQAAYIVGMVQRPNAYNPFYNRKNDEEVNEQNLKLGKERMQDVLMNMVENKKISKKEYENAASYDVKGALKTKDDTSIAFKNYPFITMAVEEEAAKVLMKADGKDPKKLSKDGKYRDTLDKYQQKVLTGGYKITTTLDEDLYKALNKAAKNSSFGKGQDLGAVLLDVETGGTLAFVGGRDYNKNQKNHALDVQRSPGSTIKPLLDFGPALDRGIISPESIIIDEKLTGPGGNVYRNYTRRYDGPMTAREALKKSINIPAIKLLRKVGLENGFNYLRKMNFPIHEHDGEASAIGGFTYGFDVQRMTAGYAMLANEGKFNEPHIISKIENSKGEVVWEAEKKPKRIFSPQAAYWTTDMLESVVRDSYGTARSTVGRSFPGISLAGKTGTSNNTEDLWFIGYTPKVALGVWTGYDYPKRIPNSNLAKHTWINLFRAVQKSDPKLLQGSFPKQPKMSYKGFEKHKVKKEKEKENNAPSDSSGSNPPPSNNNPSEEPNTGNQPNNDQSGNNDDSGSTPPDSGGDPPPEDGDTSPPTGDNPPTDGDVDINPGEES